jgi:topoisomerase-4 subunit A
MMESLFKLTELESRISLNMNVLVKGKIPKVIGLAEALREWLDHRRDVLLRRSNHRLKQIAHRLEVLGGYLIAYLNIDKVIKIIRNEDEPKPVLMKTFKLTDVQAEAILNMRLRNLRKLEEFEIRKEDKELRAEKKSLESWSARRRSSGRRIAAQIKELKEKYRQARRRSASGAPISPKRPSTTRRRSKRRWWCASRSPSCCPTRAGCARCAAMSRSCRTSPSSRTTSSSSRSSPRRRRSSWCSAPMGASTPSRPRSCRRARPRRTDAAVHRSRAGCRHRDHVPFQGGRKFIVASHQGRGFVVAEEECLGTTRKGKTVLNVKAPDEARAVATVEGDQVAAIGDNRKMLIFPLDQLPEMARGAGVRLQRYKDGGLSDVKAFKGTDGLTWTDGAGRAFSLTLKELADWRGNRADAGRLAPKGFPRSNKFK